MGFGDCVFYPCSSIQEEFNLFGITRFIITALNSFAVVQGEWRHHHRQYATRESKIVSMSGITC